MYFCYLALYHRRLFLVVKFTKNVMIINIYHECKLVSFSICSKHEIREDDGDDNK